MEVTFTVFTPVFNRGHLLGRVYNSLCSQTFLDFEWLIIDDGSSREIASLVNEWMRQGRLSIRYCYQSNRGKPYAHNRALELARGRFFAVLDSDDALAPNALARLLHHWNAIPSDRRSEYSGVTCLCMDERGELVGRPFPAPVLDCRHFEAYTLHGAVGEKWGFHRTDVVRRFPFPEVNERYCTEGLVWNRIAREFKVRHVNEMLRTFYMHGESMTSNMDFIRIQNPCSARSYYLEYLDLAIPVRYKLKKIVNYVRFSLHANVSALRLIREARHPCISLLLYPLAWLVFMTDCARAARASTSHHC